MCVKAVAVGSFHNIQTTMHWRDIPQFSVVIENGLADQNLGWTMILINSEKCDVMNILFESWHLSVCINKIQIPHALNNSQKSVIVLCTSPQIKPIFHSRFWPFTRRLRAKIMHASVQVICRYTSDNNVLFFLQCT